MQQVRLTVAGQEFAQKLNATPRQFLAPVVNPWDEFIPMDPTEGWPLANDALMILGGFLDISIEVEFMNMSSAATALAPYMGIPRPIIEEILCELRERGMIEINPTSDRELILWVAACSDVLAHESRITILRVMESGSKTAPELLAAIGELNGSVNMMTMRHHLMPLIDMGLVEKGRATKFVEYTLMRPMLWVYKRRMERVLHLTGGELQ